MDRCPAFDDAPEEIRKEYDYGDDGEYFPPTCAGHWKCGSGGHRVHEPSCGKPATWWHPDDMFAYCDEHCPERDKKFYLESWNKKK
jgi:hypothetical protein